MAKTKDIHDLFNRITCIFSPCRAWRYVWECEWDARNPSTLLGVCLNPSVADEQKGDPTVVRCVSRAQARGHGRFVMMNAAAFRSTDPKGIYGNPNAIGPDNDRYLRAAVEAVVADGGEIMFGWGTNLAKAIPGRDREIDALVRAAGGTPMALKVTKDGHPKHPLYCASALPLTPFNLPEII